MWIRLDVLIERLAAPHYRVGKEDLLCGDHSGFDDRKLCFRPVFDNPPCRADCLRLPLALLARIAAIMGGVRLLVFVHDLKHRLPVTGQTKSDILTIEFYLRGCLETKPL